MKLNFLKLILAVASIIGLNSACKKHLGSITKIALNNYDTIVANPQNPIITVNLLHAYRANETYPQCVNLYVCARISSKDTIFVFDNSASPADLIFDPASRNQGFVINQGTIKRIHAKSILVNVPVNFKIPKRISYVFATIGQPMD